MTAEFVLSELQSVGSPEKAAHLSRFFKTGPGQYGEGDRFLGVVVPQTRSIAKANKAMPLDELQRLLDSPWHEARLCALLVLVYRFQDKKTPEAEREKMYRRHRAISSHGEYAFVPVSDHRPNEEPPVQVSRKKHNRETSSETFPKVGI